MEISIRKNALETIIVRTDQFHGYDVVDIRIHYFSPDGKYLPSKKGITVRKDILDKLIDALIQVRDELNTPPEDSSEGSAGDEKDGLSSTDEKSGRNTISSSSKKKEGKEG